MVDILDQELDTNHVENAILQKTRLVGSMKVKSKTSTGQNEAMRKTLIH